MIMFEEIRSAIAAQLNVPEENITLETRFVEDLKADSLDLVELVMDLEERYGVEIPDEQLAEVKTVGQIIELIDNNK
ncbi:MAG: acyl carrier protein [Clostridia bacterium]|nr:acyl carrier protein [Clostridia bacterium]MBQ4448279.1 acyl carrier protein [Clostridia bacterium]